MNADQVNKLSNAMIKFNMIPSKRVSQKDKDFYSNMRRSFKNNKQTKTDMVLRLCLALIEDSNQINDETSEYSKEFTDIYNSYEAESVQDLVVRLHQMNTEAEQNRSKVCQEKYKEKIEYERVISVKDDQISTLHARVRELELADAKAIHGQECESEPKIETIYYQSDDDSDSNSDGEIDWKQLKVDDGQPISPPHTDGGEEDNSAKEAKEFFDRLEREHKQKAIDREAYFDKKYPKK